MQYNKSKQSEYSHVAYQRKANQIYNTVVFFGFDLVTVAIFEIKNKHSANF